MKSRRDKLLGTDPYYGGYSRIARATTAWMDEDMLRSRDDTPVDKWSVELYRKNKEAELNRKE